MFEIPSRASFFRNFRQQTTDTVTTMSTTNDINGVITYNHILSEHLGISHSSMTFSTD